MLQDNLLLRIYTERATSFLNKLKNANIVKHGPTVGDLRENAIVDSLTQLIPSDFNVESGFVVDADGSVTPQIDILVYQKNTLSPLLLTDSAVLLPIELFRFGIEVKSTIKRGDLEQVKEQAQSLASLWNSAYIAPGITSKFKKQPPPFLLVAATSELSQVTLNKELNKIEGLIGIIVFDRCILYKGGGSYEGKSDVDRVIRFWSYMFTHCIDLSNYVSITPEKELEIVTDIKMSNPQLDQNEILARLKVPSIIPYLYPGEPRDIDA